MDSGRYFWLVRLDSCLKRMPDFAVTSSKMDSGKESASTARSSLADGAIAKAPNRKDRRSNFEGTLPRLPPHRWRGPSGQIDVFLRQYCVSQARVDLAQETIDLEIDDAARFPAGGSFFTIGPSLLVVVHTHVETRAFVPHGTNLRGQFHGAVEVLSARHQVVSFGQEAPIVVIKKSIVISATLVHFQSFAIGLNGTV